MLDTKGTGIEGKWEEHGIIRISMIMIFYGEENPNHYLLYCTPYEQPMAVANYICSSRLPTLVDHKSSTGRPVSLSWVGGWVSGILKKSGDIVRGLRLQIKNQNSVYH